MPAEVCAASAGLIVAICHFGDGQTIRADILAAGDALKKRLWIMARSEDGFHLLGGAGVLVAGEAEVRTAVSVAQGAEAVAVDTPQVL